MKKNPDEITGSKASNLQRLVRCVWHLGWDLGWQYWRLQNACMVDPGLALRIAEMADQDAEMYRRAAAEARDVDSWESCTRAAEANELWAARVRECHADYSANDNNPATGSTPDDHAHS